MNLRPMMKVHSYMSHICKIGNTSTLDTVMEISELLYEAAATLK